MSTIIKKNLTAAESLAELRRHKNKKWFISSGTPFDAYVQVTKKSIAQVFADQVDWPSDPCALYNWIISDDEIVIQ